MESDFHLYLLIAILGIPAALFIDNALIRVPYGWLKQFRQAANKLKSGNNHYRSELLAEKQMLEKEKSRLIELNIKWNSLTNPAIDDIGIIPWEQYGNIAKLISIYQNVSSGKCTTLEGEKGAFRLLDKDVEEGRLYINVSKLLDKPERAKKGQELLYRELTDINSRIDRIMKSNEQIVVSFCNADWNRNQINRKLEELLEESEFGKYIRECEEKMERYTERLKELTGGTFILSEVDYSDLD